MVRDLDLSTYVGPEIVSRMSDHPVCFSIFPLILCHPHTFNTVECPLWMGSKPPSLRSKSLTTEEYPPLRNRPWTFYPSSFSKRICTYFLPPLTTYKLWLNFESFHLINCRSLSSLFTSTLPENPVQFLKTYKFNSFTFRWLPKKMNSPFHCISINVETHMVRLLSNPFCSVWIYKGSNTHFDQVPFFYVSF